MYKPRADGLDVVEFLLAAGPAEPLRPLGAVASGGEQSRIMLALKAAPAAVQSSTPSNVGESLLRTFIPTACHKANPLMLPLTASANLD